MNRQTMRHDILKVALDEGYYSGVTPNSPLAAEMAQLCVDGLLLLSRSEGNTNQLFLSLTEKGREELARMAQVAGLLALVLRDVIRSGVAITDVRANGTTLEVNLQTPAGKFTISLEVGR